MPHALQGSLPGVPKHKAPLCLAITSATILYSHFSHLHILMPPQPARYAENQALLGSADQLVAQQADLIRQLEVRLAAAEGAAGRSQAARIGELQQQVAALQVRTGTDPQVHAGV
jgi:hypothetical protein